MPPHRSENIRLCIEHVEFVPQAAQRSAIIRTRQDPAIDRQGHRATRREIDNDEETKQRSGPQHVDRSWKRLGLRKKLRLQMNEQGAAESQRGSRRNLQAALDQDIGCSKSGKKEDRPNQR